MFHYTIYLSKATEGTNAEIMNEIVAKSKENNLNAGISGILFYKNGWYLQYLEGPGENIQVLMSSIKTDSGNSEVSEVLSGISRDKLFSGSMEFVNLDSISEQDTALHGLKSAEINFPELKKDPSVLLEFIRHFAD